MTALASLPQRCLELKARAAAVEGEEHRRVGGFYHSPPLWMPQGPVTSGLHKGTVI